MINKQSLSDNSVPLAPSVDAVAKIVEDSQLHRTQASAARLQKKGAPFVVPSIHTTAALDRAKHGGGPPGSEKILISFAVRVRTSSKRDQQTTDPSFGTWGRSWSKDVFMSGMLSVQTCSATSHIVAEVQDDALLHANLSWTKTESWPLTRLVHCSLIACSAVLTHFIAMILCFALLATK